MDKLYGIFFFCLPIRVCVEKMVLNLELFTLLLYLYSHEKTNLFMLLKSNKLLQIKMESPSLCSTHIFAMLEVKVDGIYIPTNGGLAQA